jgi:hypothetical protein
VTSFFKNREPQLRWNALLFGVYGMKDVLNRLIIGNKGPWTDCSLETRAECIQVCEAVAGEIIFSITGKHPAACDGVSVEYDFYKDIWLFVTFMDRGTHTAEQIATAFQEIAGVAVNVKVWECVSEHISA